VNSSRAEVPGSGLVSPRSLAEIARAGFGIVLQPTMRVAYEVHHVMDHPGYLYDVLRNRPGSGRRGRQSAESLNAPPLPGLSVETPPERFIETLTTAAHGIGLVIGTRTVSGATEASAPPGTIERVSVDRRPERARRFTSSAVPNVSFVYDATHVFEGLIAIGTRETPLQLRHGRAVLDVMEKVAELAADIARAPILSLQSPVQLPPRPEHEVLQDARPRSWPRASAAAVRFAIALSEPSAALRLRLMDAASKFCDENGFAFWVADTRAGFRAGNWFSICAHDPDRLEDYFERTGAGGGLHPPAWSLPVTFVGPARIGAVKSIVRYLGHYAPIGIIACSMSIMDDVAFIHLQLTTETASEDSASTLSRHIDSFMADTEQPTRLQQAEPLELLPELMKSMAGEGITPPPSDRWADLTLRVRDFHLLPGPVRTITDDRGELRSKRRALWVAWEVEGREAELSIPFLALFEALQGLMPWVDDQHRPDGPNVEYLICRRVRHALLRGKGKLSFPNRIRGLIAGDDLQAGLTAFSERIEEAWRAHLGPQHRVRELTVSWRENWLGHWTSSLD